MPEGNTKEPQPTPRPPAADQGGNDAEPAEALGYRRLAMNEIAPQKTEEASEVGARAGSRWLILVGVLAAAVVIYLVGRALLNLRPGAEAEARLRVKLTELPAWQTGVIQGARYLSGDTLRVDFSARLAIPREDARAEIRKATRAVMDILMQERPGRDLHILGFQGEEKVVQGDYRQKASLPGPNGQSVLDISIRVKGDPESVTEEAGKATGPGPGE